MDQNNQENSNFDQDTFEIQVEVTDPVVKDGVQKYVLYSMRGTDKKGAFEVLRRYSDYDHVRQALVSRWPGCYVPPIPSKKAVGNMDQKFIEERRAFLEMFCQQLARIKYLWYSEEWEAFLRGSSDIERNLEKLPKQNHQKLIEKYTEKFSNLSGKEISSEHLEKIRQFEGFLRKAQPVIENFKVMATNIIEQNEKHKEQIILFLDYLMPEYEKNCMTEYVVNPEGRLIFQNSTALQSYGPFKDVLQRKQMYELYQLVKIESREIEAFLEAIQAREQYEKLKMDKENKKKELEQEQKDIETGKTTLKSIFQKGNKEDAIKKIQSDIEQTQKDIESLQFLTDIITVILCHAEIDLFKGQKEQKYYNMLKTISQVEIEIAKCSLDFWNEILQNQNLAEL